MENPIKMDDLGVPPFKEPPICCSRELKPPSHPYYFHTSPHPESLCHMGNGMGPRGSPKLLLGLWRNPGVLFGIFRVWPQHKGSKNPKKATCHPVKVQGIFPVPRWWQLKKFLFLHPQKLTWIPKMMGLGKGGSL